MNLTILFFSIGVISFVSYFVGAYIERYVVKEPPKKYTKHPVVEYTLEPAVIKFEHMCSPIDEQFLKLTPEEAAWQRRRVIATKVADFFFTELMRENTELAETVIHDKCSHMMDSYITTTYIRILRPVKQ